ncbi:MAG: hypothetical protein ACI3YT_10185 [Prevotella sp.]
MLKINLTEQAAARLFESGSKIIESAIGKAFSTDVKGEIVIPSAVSDNYQFFSDLQEAANTVEENRIIQALENKQLSQQALIRLNNLIAIIMSKAETEYYELLVFQPEFLNNFATKSNSCFKRAKRLLLRSSVTIKKSMKLFQQFTPKLKNPQERRKAAGYGDEWTIANSHLTMSTTQSYISFENTFSTEAETLIESIERLMRILGQLMALCCETLEKEVNILNDLEKLEWIHNRQFESLRTQACLMIDYVKTQGIDQMSKLRADLTWDEFLRQAYHFFSDTAMAIYVAYQMLIESKNKNIDNDFEKAHLPDDDKRYAIRRAIENFDDMNPRGRGGVLSSFHLAALYLWSGINCGQKEFYDYFWEIYKGKYSKVSISCFSDMIGLIHGHSKTKQSEKAKQSEKTERYKKLYEMFKADMKKNGFYI